MRFPRLFPFGRSAKDAPSSRRRGKPTEPPNGFDVGKLIYAVGDVHGKHDLLVRLLERIETDAAATKGDREILVVFMGDYVDRGAASAAVLREIAKLRPESNTEIVCLLGNHERAMLDFIANPIAHAMWLRMGGIETVQSFGVRAVAPNAPDTELTDCADALADAMGDLREFLRKRTVLQHAEGNVQFCHAAVDRSAPLDQQDETVLLWGTKEFIDLGGHPGHWFVHGHTISAEPEIFANRIGVDTGAYMSGKLSAARIGTEGCSFLSVRMTD